jgi:5,10-methylene-tetrahydrofolate dehydrogenase/methenyl tetrahydrofolate cyclohydrolase
MMDQSLHPANVGKLVVRGKVPPIQPCTPKGIMELIRSTGKLLEMFRIGRHIGLCIMWRHVVGTSIAGKNATVVGRGDLVVSNQTKLSRYFTSVHRKMSQSLISLALVDDGLCY